MWNHLWVCSWSRQWTQASIVSSNDKTSYTTNSLVSHESPSSPKAIACAIYFNRTKWSCHRNMSDDYIENTGQRELAKKNKIPNFYFISKLSSSVLLVQIALLLFFQLTVCCLKLYFPKVTSNETEKNEEIWKLSTLKSILLIKHFRFL